MGFELVCQPSDLLCIYGGHDKILVFAVCFDERLEQKSVELALLVELQLASKRCVCKCIFEQRSREVFLEIFACVGIKTAADKKSGS